MSSPSRALRNANATITLLALALVWENAEDGEWLPVPVYALLVVLSAGLTVMHHRDMRHAP